MPAISIVMPTYNRGKDFLPEAVKSVLAQSFTDFELIVVDDASTDNTAQVITAFDDPRIVYLQSDHNHGEYWATNFGVNRAQGKYLTWVHSDDLLPPDSLERRFASLEGLPDLDFVHGDIDRIDETGTLTERLDSVTWDKYKIVQQYLMKPEERERKYIIHHTTVLMKWKFFYQAGPFDCSLPYAGDIDWLIRAVIRGRFQYIPATLYRYRTHSGTRRATDPQHGVDKQAVRDMITRRYL